MPKNEKSPEPPKPDETSTPAAQDKPADTAKPAAQDKPAATDKPAKKKLTLDVTDVNEVLERKISP